MARLLADENFPFPVVEALRLAGHDVVTLEDVGQAGISLADREVLAAASLDGRAVVTLDRRDFLRLHRDDPAHAGIVLCTFDLDFAGQAARIDETIRPFESLMGRLVRVNRS